MGLPTSSNCRKSQPCDLATLQARQTPPSTLNPIMIITDMVRLALPVLSCQAALPFSNPSVSPLEEAAFQHRRKSLWILHLVNAGCKAKFAASTSDYIPDMLNHSADGLLLDKLTNNVFTSCLHGFLFKTMVHLCRFM